MSCSFPRLVQRHARVLIATVAAVAIAAATMFAQFGAFDPQHEGQLWGVRQELPSAGGYPAGTVFVGGTLFVADQGNQQVVAYDTTTWAAVDVSGGDWNDITTVGAPAFGLIVNEMAKATVNGADAILISDLSQPRVLAFDTTGAHLFTLRLANPNATPNDTYPLINGVAMGPGASFTLASGNLSLAGAFAAGWTNAGRNNGAALAFRNVASFTFSGGEYSGTPVVLNGTEGSGVGVVAGEIYGVVFDSVGNLYTLDTLTERLNVYDSTNGFAHRFRFGTPATDNGVEEFAQPFGLAFWPDANGGRLLVADDLNNRIAVYRPNLNTNTLDFITNIDRMVPAVDPQPFSISIDPLTASIAVSDFSTPSVWILRTADLVVYNMQVLDDGGLPVDTVCAGAPYQVRVSLTVPAGHPDAANVVPLLTVGGTAVTGVTPVPADSYPATPMQAGQVATYTFPLTMAANALGDIEIVASASSTSTNDVLSAFGLVTASDCPANNAAPVITTSQSPATQVSGWTPVYGPQVTELTLNVTDDDAVQRLEYRITGTNDSGNTIPPVIFSGTSASESVTVQLPEEGESTIEYRARDNNNVWSAWQSTAVRIVRVIDRQSNEGDQNTFTVGQSVGSGYQFSATNLPPGASIDPNTGQISGLLLFDAAGVYNITLTETLGAATSSVNFTWTVLNVNRHPTITPLGPNAIPTITEGVPMTPIQIAGFDPDGDTVFWTAYGRSIPLGYELPPGVAIDPATGIISGTFPMDSEPAYNITVGLSECAATSNDHPVVCAGAQPRIGLATLYEITLNVTNVNQPPDIIDPGDKTNAEGDTITPLQIVASDPDLAFGDDVDFEAEGLPPGLSINPETGLITGTVSYTAGPQVYAVVIRARDTEAAQPLPFETFNWTITDAPPTITALPDRTDYEGDVINISVVASDPGGAAVTYSATNLPHGMSINPTTGQVTGTLAYDAAGVYNVTVTVTKGAVSRSDTFIWTVLERNSQPTISAPDRTNMEGDSIAPVMVATATDPEGDVLIYSATGLPPGLVMLPTGLVSGVISPTGEGVYTVTVSVRDSLLGTPISTTFTWTVNGINRPPTIDSVDQFSNEGDTVSYVVAGVDPDGDTLSYTMTGTLPATHSINPATGAISGTFSFQSAGVYTITVRVTDGQFAASTTFLWTVRDINRPPVVNPVDQFNREGDSASYAVSGSDPDGDTLVWTATGLPPGFTISSTGVISGTFGPGSAGVYNINVAVCDALLCATKPFVWTVGANMPPTVFHPNRTNVEGDTVSYATTASDPDGDALTYSATGLPPGISINPSTGQLTGTLGYNTAGTYNPTITVSDGRLTAAHTFNWIVTNTNRPPDAVNDVASVNQGQSVTVTVLNLDSDPDGDALTVTAITQPAQGTAVLNANGTVTYTAPANFSGVTTFTYTIVDGNGGTDTATVTISVGDVNFPPTVFHANRVNAEGDTVSYLSTASDPDGDVLTFSATGLPAGISINPATGQLTGTLGYNTAGTYNPTITVSDGGLTASHTFNWIVTATNRPPDAVNDAASVNQGQSVNITVLNLDSDPDGDTLTVTAITQPAVGSAVLNADGTVTYTAPSTFAGTTTFTYTISDGNGGTDTATVTITVRNVNFPPVVTHPNRTNVEGDTVTYATTASDPDNDVLTFTATGLPAGISINPATGTLAGTLGYNTAGTYNPTITVSDGTLTASHTFNWVVTNTNRPPDAVNDVATVNQGQSVNITVLNLDSDPDGDTLTVTAITQPAQGTAVLNANGTVTYTAPLSFAGTTTFTYTISDGKGGTDTATVTITVLALPPTCNLAGYVTYSQGGWGGSGAPGQLMTSKFSQVYPGGFVIIGGTKTLKFTSASAITAFLPQGATPAVLTASAVNPTSSSAGNFAAQVLALRLAVDYSNAGVLKAGLGDLVMLSGPFANQSVNQILATANAVLGGSTSSLPSGMTVSTLNGIIESLNLNFHEGTVNTGLLGCPAGPTVPTCVAGTMVTTGNSSTSGTAGNLRTFTQGDVSVKVSAFARTKSSGAWTTAFLGAFSPGLGVTDGSEGSGVDDSHKVDNVGDRVNYVLYEFSKPVKVTKAYLDYIGTDGDVTVWVGTKTDPFNNHQTLSDAFLSGLAMTEAVDSASSTTRWVEFNGGNVTGNVLVIAARPDGTNDSFKLGKLQFEACSTTNAPANTAPTVAVPDRSDYKKVAVNVQVTGTDTNGDALTYTATGLPAGTSMSAAGLITGTPTVTGTYTVTVTVKDPSNATGTDTFVWTIQNHAPTITTSNITANVGQSGAAQAVGSDLDGDALTYSVTGLPPGISMNSAGTFSGTLTTAGVYTVTVTVKDVDNATGFSTFTVTVVQPNRAPVAVNDSASTRKNSSVTINVLANDTDADGDVLTVSIGSCANGTLTLNSNKTIKFTPKSNYKGTTTFTYTVNDGKGGSATATVTVTVT